MYINNEYKSDQNGSKNAKIDLKSTCNKIEPTPIQLNFPLFARFADNFRNCSKMALRWLHWLKKTQIDPKWLEMAQKRTQNEIKSGMPSLPKLLFNSIFEFLTISLKNSKLVKIRLKPTKMTQNCPKTDPKWNEVRNVNVVKATF